MTDRQALDTQQALLLRLPEKRIPGPSLAATEGGAQLPVQTRVPPPPLPCHRQLGSGEGVPSPVAALQALEGIHQPQLRVRERPQLLKGSRIQLFLLFFPLGRPQGKHRR